MGEGTGLVAQVRCADGVRFDLPQLLDTHAAFAGVAEITRINGWEDAWEVAHQALRLTYSGLSVFVREHVQSGGYFRVAPAGPGSLQLHAAVQYLWEASVAETQRDMVWALHEAAVWARHASVRYAAMHAAEAL